MPLADGIYRIVNVSTKTALTAGAASGAKVTGSKDTEGLNQQWNVSSQGSDSYVLVAVDPDFFATVRPLPSGGQELISNYNPTKWTISSAGGGFYSLCLAGIAFAVNNFVWQLDSSNDGTEVTLGPNAGSNAQKWKFVPQQK